MDQQGILRGYADEAATLIPAYEMLKTTEVLSTVQSLLPARPSRILDVGAGTGRDAAYFARQGHSVVAVEPVREFREAGMALHPSGDIRWLDDRLPTLERMIGEAVRYDLVLTIGVWQHVPSEEHGSAISTLSKIVGKGGRLIISVRHGPGSRTRPCFPADPDRIVNYARKCGLQLGMRRSAASIQEANRDLGVKWTWLCLEAH